MEHDNKIHPPYVTEGLQGRTPGEMILARRRELGWSQTDLEWKSGVSARQIGRIESDLVNPAFETVEKLEAALGISLMETYVAHRRAKEAEKKAEKESEKAIRKLRQEIRKRGLSEEAAVGVIEKIFTALEEEK